MSHSAFAAAWPCWLEAPAFQMPKRPATQNPILSPPIQNMPTFTRAKAAPSRRASIGPRLSPLPRRPIVPRSRGDTTVTFTAPGMTKAEVLCWQQPTTDDSNAYGHDAVVATLDLDSSGAGSFVFHADNFPNGPITLRIHAKDAGKKQDLCQLQLFNQGGAVWNQGIPKSDPPAAQGLKLVFFRRLRQAAVYFGERGRRHLRGTQDRRW